MGLPDLVGGASLQKLLSIASINDLDNRPFAIAVDFLQEAIPEGNSNTVIDNEIDLGEGETVLHRIYTNTQAPTNRRVVVGFYTQQAEDVEGDQESYEVFEITTLRRDEQGIEEIVAQSIIREMTIDPLRRGWRNNTHVLEYATWLDGLDRAQDPLQRLQTAIQTWQERDKTQDKRTPVFDETHATGMIKPQAVTEFVGF